jgi:hypothetical protein
MGWVPWHPERGSRVIPSPLDVSCELPIGGKRPAYNARIGDFFELKTQGVCIRCGRQTQHSGDHYKFENLIRPLHFTSGLGGLYATSSIAGVRLLIKVNPISELRLAGRMAQRHGGGESLPGRLCYRCEPPQAHARARRGSVRTRRRCLYGALG